MASRMSKAYSSDFFPLRSFWKMPRMGSNWFSATIVFSILGIRADNNRVQAGTLPLVSHNDGFRSGANNDL